jgi:alkylated DNA repair dioxygenase AlkB
MLDLRRREFITRLAGRKAGNKWERFTLNAQPRSLYVMTDASRHLWEHIIPPVETPRYSITFRTMA